MNQDWMRFAAICLLAFLGLGVIVFLCAGVISDGKINISEGGLVAAAFLSLREVVSKIEKVSLGVRTPEPSPPIRSEED